MKKQIRQLTAILLMVMTMLSITLFVPVETNAAEANGKSVSASCVKSQAEAVAWLNAQEGARYDIDGAYGSQCADFSSAYVNYVLTGNPYGGRISVYDAYAYSNANLYPSDWQVFSNSASFVPEPGDIFVVTGADSNYGHTGVVISSTTNTATIVDQNGMSDWNLYTGSPAHIHNIMWSGSFTPKYFIRPCFSAGGNNPQGVLDGATGGEGTVSLSGWAFDRDDLNTPLEIHVYIGGRSGEANAEGRNGVIANQGRPDVNAVYGCGDYHGFSATIATDKRGVQPIYVYALNIGNGDNVQIGEGTVTIAEDTNVKNIWIDEDKDVLLKGETNTFSFGADRATRFDIQITKDGTEWIYEDNVSSGVTYTFNEIGFYRVYVCGHNGDKYLDSEKIYFDVVDSAENVISLANSQPLINKQKLDLGTEFYATIEHTDSGKLVTDNNIFDDSGLFTNAVIYENINQDNQVWKFKKFDDGSYQIVSMFSGRCLNNYYALGSAGSNVVVHPVDDSVASRWYVVKGKAGNTFLVPQSSTNCALDLYGNDSTNYQNIQLWDYHGNLSQRFSINKVDFEVAKTYYKGNVYKLCSLETSWAAAEEYCEKMGGHLVTFASEDEFNAVREMLAKQSYPLAWIGAESNSGNWSWVTKEPFTYTKWNAGQPDNAGGIEHYATTWGSEAQWNDISERYSSVKHFICEFDKKHSMGDANLDDVVNVRDVTAIQRSIAELEQFNDGQYALSDINGDNTIDIYDVTLLQQYLAEFDVQLG